MPRYSVYSILCVLLCGTLLLTGCGAQPPAASGESDPAATTTAFTASSENTDSTAETQASLSTESTSESATAVGTTADSAKTTTAPGTTTAQNTVSTTLPPAPPPTTEAQLPIGERQNAQYKYEVYPDYVDITEYIGSDAAVNIPSKIDGLPVTALGSHAFTEKDIVEVTIPSSVRAIGSQTFAGCKKLTTVHLPGTPLSLSLKSFASTPWAAALTEEFAVRGNILMKYNGTAQNVTIPNGVKGIAAGFMTGKTADTVTVPDSVTLLSDFAFSSSKICKVVLPKALTSIPDYAFEGAAVEEVRLPSGLKSIGTQAFAACEKLKKLDIPDSVTWLGLSPFRQSGIEFLRIPDKASGWENAYFESGITTFHMPNHATVIPETAFSWCVNLKKVTVPSRVQSILTYAFANCSKLETVVLEAGVKTIAESAFTDCTSLKDVTIPATVNTIAETAFANCPKSLRIHGKTGSAAEQYAKKQGFTFVSE